jgi:glycosyltransferase involved in cell wall biosynthesis
MMSGREKMRTCWAILTGEYPPQSGGVADYTRQIATALAKAGDIVHVFAPHAAALPNEGGVQVHRLPGNFDRRSRALVEIELAKLGVPRRVLVQYVPHAYGCRAMNVGFAWWIRSLARAGERVDVMFHEVAYPLERGQPLKHQVLGFVTRHMARCIARSAERILISTQAWGPLLRQLGVDRSMQWLPVPTNLTEVPDAAAVDLVRERLGGSAVIAHFGAYGHRMATFESALKLLAERDAHRVILLLGRGSEEFAAALREAHPSLAGQVRATGSLGPGQIAAHLMACDVLLQPYPDGVSCRRSSTMAGLALGVAVVTHAGPSTEAVWKESEGVLLAESAEGLDMAAAVESLLSNPAKLQALRADGRALYDSKFTLRIAITALQD